MERHHEFGKKVTEFKNCKGQVSKAEFVILQLTRFDSAMLLLKGNHANWFEGTILNTAIKNRISYT